MSFFAPFSEHEKDLFRTASSLMELPRGNYLMRRGEPGGDVFLVEEGSLEVVDRRATPEVILAVLRPGAVVGEMAYLEDTPRSADVRAAEDTVIRRWSRADLRAMLEREPIVGSRFYEAVARMASQRIRTLTTTAVAGGLGRGEGIDRPGAERVKGDVTALSDATKEALLQAETELRTEASSEQATARVRATLDRLQREMVALFGSISDPEVAEDATRLLGRELHPYLVRASLADRTLRKQQAGAHAAEVLAHVLVDTAGGDGQLGEIIDRWLLDRPTLQAIRAVRLAVVEPTATLLPSHRNRRIFFLNAGTGSLVASLSTRLGDAPTVVTVMDSSRDALAFLDAGVALRPRKVELRTIQASAAEFAMGRLRHDLPPQDAIIIHGLIEYMPDRIAVALLRQVHRCLAPDGIVVAMALAPSDDSVLLDRLLDWPSVRRRPERLHRLFDRAGFERIEDPPRDDALLLVRARRHP